MVEALSVYNAAFVTDSYFPASTQAYIRQLRQDKREISRVHVFKPEMPAHPKSSILSVSKNKIQLQRMLGNALLAPQFYIPATQ